MVNNPILGIPHSINKLSLRSLIYNIWCQRLFATPPQIAVLLPVPSNLSKAKMGISCIKRSKVLGITLWVSFPLPNFNAGATTVECKMIASLRHSHNEITHANLCSVPEYVNDMCLATHEHRIRSMTTRYKLSWACRIYPRYCGTFNRS